VSTRQKWAYVVDPMFSGQEEVPSWAIAGAYPVDERGEVDESAFTANPDYRPTPMAMGLPAPSNELEAVMQLAATNHGSDDRVREMLLGAEVFVADELTGDPVPVFTSEYFLPAEWQGGRRVAVRELVGELGARQLVINPDSRLELRLPSADLA
jgi:hypothetical protein